MSDVLTPLLEKYVEDGLMPGAVVVVACHERRRTWTIGSMAVDGPPMREDALMRIRSMTKPIVAVATMRDVQGGKLALDEPIATWLPELADPQVLVDPAGPLDDVEPARRPIILRDLLVNGCGYGLEPHDTPLREAMRRASVDGDDDPPTMGADEWLAALSRLPLAHQPGRGFRYHHGYAILGILLQRFSGKPLEEYLHRKVLDPLGMVDTAFFVPESKRDRIPAVYRHDGHRLIETVPLGGTFHVGEPPYDLAHGEMMSTAHDYHRLTHMLAESGRHEGKVFLRPEWRLEMLRDQVPDRFKPAGTFHPGFWDCTGWGYGASVVTEGEMAGTYGWSGGHGTDFSIGVDGTTVILFSTVDLGDRMRDVVLEVQRAARTVLDDED